MALWSRLPRARAVPVPEGLTTLAGERVLATAATADEEVVVITTQRLVVPGGDLDEGRPWHLVDRGRWDPDTDVLSVTWVDGSPAGRWRLTRPCRCCNASSPSPVRCGATKPTPSRVKPMSHGATSWIKEIPKLPMPAWMPSAVPERRLGKK